jgi:hypothetical protein
MCRPGMGPFERMAADVAGDEYREKAAEAAGLMSQAARILNELVQGTLDTDDAKLKGNVEAIHPEVDQLAFKLAFALRQGSD